MQIDKFPEKNLVQRRRSLHQQAGLVYAFQHRWEILVDTRITTCC